MNIRPPQIPLDVWESSCRPVTLIGGPRDGEQIELHLGAVVHHISERQLDDGSWWDSSYWLNPDGETMTYVEQP